MIIEILPNGKLYTIGVAQAVKAITATIPPKPEIFEPPCVCECPYEELVFGKAGGQWYENDLNDFLFTKRSSSDTIAFELWKNGVKKADINNTTYGTYYSTFTEQPLYVGLVVDWQKVLAVEGIGVYQIKSPQTILGNATTFESQLFRLMPYSDELANGTIRIEGYQTGNIVGHELNHYNLLTNGWYYSNRFKGFLKQETPKYIKDNYVNQNYELSQIQETLINNWELELGLIPNILYNKIVKEICLANKILISDYNTYNTDIFRRVNLNFLEISDKKTFRKNKNISLYLKFEDKVQNWIKNNF